MGTVAKTRVRYMKFISPIQKPIQEKKNADVKLNINGNKPFIQYRIADTLTSLYHQEINTYKTVKTC